MPPTKEYETIPRENAERLRAYNMSEGGKVQASLQQELIDRANLFGVPVELLTAPFIPICSVWPKDLTCGPFHHGGQGRRFYTIGAGSPVKPTVLLVQSTYDWIQTNGPQGMAELQMGAIPAAALAKDLIQHWCGDHPGNTAGKRGVGVIKGEIVAIDSNTPAVPGLTTNWTVKPTKDEVDFLSNVQTSYLRWLIDRADEFHASRNPVDGLKISLEHKEALTILGLDEKQHPWFRSKASIAYSTCPNCAQMILRDAIYCQVCRQSVIDYFTTFGLTPDPEEWPRVASIMQAKNKPEPAKANKDKN